MPAQNDYWAEWLLPVSTSGLASDLPRRLATLLCTIALAAGVPMCVATSTRRDAREAPRPFVERIIVAGPTTSKMCGARYVGWPCQVSVVEVGCHSGGVRCLIELEFVTSLDAEADDVWRFVSSMKGVNFELHPFVHMTSGSDHRVLPTSITPGSVIFRSWLLLFRVLPFDRHALAFDQLEQGRGFIEESTSWLQRRWYHERSLTTRPGGGSSIVDRLVVEPRLRVTRPFVALIVRHLFQHRHRQLERRFGIVAQ